MLTEAEVESPRASVVASHQRRGFKGQVERIRFIDGPLANIESVVEEVTVPPTDKLRIALRAGLNTLIGK